MAGPSAASTGRSLALPSRRTASREIDTRALISAVRPKGGATERSLAGRAARRGEPRTPARTPRRRAHAAKATWLIGGRRGYRCERAWPPPRAGAAAWPRGTYARGGATAPLRSGNLAPGAKRYGGGRYGATPGWKCVKRQGWRHPPQPYHAKNAGPRSPKAGHGPQPHTHGAASHVQPYTG